MRISRRHLLAGYASTVFASVTGAAIFAPFVARAQQAQWSYKYANNLPDTHPMNVRARDMAKGRRRLGKSPMHVKGATL